MHCPYCDHHETKVIDSREAEDGLTIRRRRECLQCQQRFSTKEKVEILKLTVVKRNGEKEAYEREKMAQSLRIATNKRLKKDRLQRLVCQVEREIFAQGKQVIETRQIGQIILRRLEKIDEVAYLRYASVFKSFGSGRRFTKELNRLH